MKLDTSSSAGSPEACEYDLHNIPLPGFVRFSIHTIFLICCLLPYASLHRTLVFGIWARKLCDIYSSIGCALSSFRPPLGPPFDFLLNFCSCQTARCFNKSKGVLITGLKLKAFRNPQPSWGFSIDNYRPDGDRAGVNQDRTCCSIAQATPSSRFDLVTKLATSLTDGMALSIATPIPAYSIIAMSFS